MKIEFTTIPKSSHIDFLRQKIDEETPEYGEIPSFAFFAKDENDQIIGGCNGFIVHGAIYTDQLWVHKDYRKNGLGRKIMEHVHIYAQNQECKMATVCTMSFQGSLGFYEKLGYKVDFERQGYTNNSKCIFLSKKV